MNSGQKFSLLKMIDMFGRPYPLSFNKEKQLQTRLGGILTIIMFLLLALALVFFGMQLFARINPNLITKVRPSNREKLKFGLNMAYIIENQYNTIYRNAMEYLTIESYYVEIIYKVGPDGFYNASMKNYSLTTKNCNELDFSEENRDSFAQNNLKYGTCVEDHEEIEGFFDRSYVTFVVTEVNRCVNTTTRTCKRSKEEIDDFLNSNPLQLSIYYEELDFNPMNFSNPLKTYMTVDSYVLSDDLCKTENYFFMENIIMTDIGWFDNSYNVTKMQEFEKVESRFYLKDKSEKCLVKTRIFVSEYTKYNYRIYMKAQDLLAQLGAIFNLISKIFLVIVTIIYNKKMDHIIMNKIFKVYNDDYDEKSQPKIELMVDPKLTENDQQNNDMMKRNDNDKSSKNEMILKSSNLIFDINKVIENRNSKEEDQFYITLEEFIVTSFCPCFTSKKTKKKENIFNEMTKFTIEYTDIVNYALLKSEFEKLLFVIFNKTQLALFNLIPCPQNPERKGEVSNVTKAYQYTKSLTEQESLISNTKEWNGELDKKLIYLLN